MCEREGNVQKSLRSRKFLPLCPDKFRLSALFDRKQTSSIRDYTQRNAGHFIGKLYLYYIYVENI